MANWASRLGLLLLSISLAGASGCAVGDGGTGSSKQNAASVQPGAGGSAPQAYSAPGDMQALASNDAVIPLYSENNLKYVPLPVLIQVLEFNSDWDPATKTMRIGDTDDPYVITMDSTSAQKDGDPITLPAAPIFHSDTAYLPVSALADLMRDVMDYDVQDGRLVIHPSTDKPVSLDDPNDAATTDDELSFADDPNDPYKGPIPEESDTVPSAGRLGGIADINESAIPQDEIEAIPAALKNINMNSLIRVGMRYMGVKYKFGAAPYPRSGRFDCSTFTKYIFGKFGVYLPRLARQQGLRGIHVSRKHLRKGDLMFFYVPGRFRSNRVVGHVGIYMGNGKMLHSCPKPKNGVQISHINTRYWKRVFLFAKRVAY